MHIPCYKPWNSGSKHICQYKPRLLSSSPTRGPKLTQLVKNRTTTSGKELKPSSSSKVVKRSVVRRLSGEIEPLPCRWTFFDGHNWVAGSYSCHTKTGPFLVGKPWLHSCLQIQNMHIHYIWVENCCCSTKLGSWDVWMLRVDECRYLARNGARENGGAGGQKFPQNVSCLQSSIICVPTQQ